MGIWTRFKKSCCWRTLFQYLSDWLPRSAYRPILYETNYTDDSASPVQKWNYEWGHEIKELAISGDGSYIVAGSENDDRVRVFKKSSSTPVLSIAPPTSGNIYGVAISSNGKYFAKGY